MRDRKPHAQTRAEQETVIRWDREDPQVSLFSANPAVWRKLARLGIEPVRRSTRRGQETGRFYVFPVAVLRWGVKSAARAEASRVRAAGRPPAFGNRGLAADSGPEPGSAGSRAS